MGFFKNLLDGGAGEAQKKNEANAAGLASMLSTQYGLGSGFLQQGMAGLDTSFANQKAALSGYGTQAANQIIQQGAQNQAAQKSSLVSKGLHNTSVGANLAQQSQAGTNAALASLGQNLGLLHANVEQQHGAAKQQGFQNLAQYAMSKVGMQSQITPQYQGGTGLLAGLGSGLGQALGAGAVGGLGSLFGGGAAKAATGPQFPKTGAGNLAYGPPS